MAPTNDYLMADDVLQRLGAHDPKLVKCSTSWFLGEEPEIHRDFNRTQEISRLAAYLDRCTEADFSEGNVTIDDAARSVYGYTDDYLCHRIASTHLNPGSAFNKSLPNGTVAMLGPEGVIVHGNRIQVAEAELQIALDKLNHRVVKTATSEAKGLARAERKAMRIAPDASDQLRELTRSAVEETFGTAQRALGRGSDD